MLSIILSVFVFCLFGTYENPREWIHPCGFDEDKEQQLLRMLAYQDVHE